MQPPKKGDGSEAEGPWSVGLCGCCSDLETCCTAFWCPCITFGRIAEIVDHGSTSCGVSGALYTLILCPRFYSCCYRTRMRKQYNLKGGTCRDCLLHCFCESCALTQAYRELQYRGFDMSLGWYGKGEMQNRAIATVPPVEQEMAK